jgi:hypothetical protein
MVHRVNTFKVPYVSQAHLSQQQQTHMLTHSCPNIPLQFTLGIFVCAYGAGDGIQDLIYAR